MSKIKFLLTSVLLFAHIEASADHTTLGAVAMDAPVEMIKRMTPLTAYIAKRIGHEVQFRLAPNMDTAVTDLGNGTVQIAYMTPFSYIMAHEKYHAIPLVSPLTHGKATFNLMVVVQKDSPAKSLEDLRASGLHLGTRWHCYNLQYCCRRVLKNRIFRQLRILSITTILPRRFCSGILMAVS